MAFNKDVEVEVGGKSRNGPAWLIYYVSLLGTGWLGCFFLNHRNGKKQLYFLGFMKPFLEGDIGSLREYIIAGTLYGVIFDDVFCFVSLGYKGGEISMDM